MLESPLLHLQVAGFLSWLGTVPLVTSELPFNLPIKLSHIELGSLKIGEKKTLLIDLSF